MDNYYAFFAETSKLAQSRSKMNILACVLRVTVILVSCRAQTLNKNSSRILTVPDKPVIKIVVYDNIVGYLNWIQDWFIKHAATKCPNSVCNLSRDKSSIDRADIIVFHAPTHNREGLRFPRNVRKGSIKVLFSLEQPKYAQILSDREDIQANFDLLATYSMSHYYPGTSVPNMPLTYYPLNIKPPEAVLLPAKPFSEKTGYNTGVNVVVFTSNCKAAGAAQRTTFVKELMKYIPVHSYGKCFNNREEPEMPEDPSWPPQAQRRGRKVKVLSHYKFYLAFENLEVQDYVSEKIFEGLLAGSLPVYRGTQGLHLKN